MAVGAKSRFLPNYYLKVSLAAWAPEESVEHYNFLLLKLLMRILKRGAEAVLYLEQAEEGRVLVKERIPKRYRLAELDTRLRKLRTRKEARLLVEARKRGVPTPKIFEVDEQKAKIRMEFLEGKLLRDFLLEEKIDRIEKICLKLGRLVGRLHAADLVHSDLTPSNIIVKNDELYFFDFGLGEFSRRVEDKAVDLRLLHQALQATHGRILKKAWELIVKGYREEYKDAEKVLERMREIAKRVRYA